MPDFNTFLMRHGESVLQDLVERIERNEGIVAHTNLPLEERWDALMTKTCALGIVPQFPAVVNRRG